MVSSGVLVWKLRHLDNHPDGKTQPSPSLPVALLPPTTAPTSDGKTQPSPSLPVALLPPTTASDDCEGCSETGCSFFEDAESQKLSPTPLNKKQEKSIFF